MADHGEGEVVIDNHYSHGLVEQLHLALVPLGERSVYTQEEYERKPNELREDNKLEVRQCQYQGVHGKEHDSLDQKDWRVD